MTTLSDAQVLTYLDELIAANNAGLINWVQPNPTTFVWNIPGRAVVTLQKTIIVRSQQMPNRAGAQNVQINGFVFQVQDMNTGATRLATTADQSSPAGAKLAQLFDTVNDRIVKQNLDFLHSLVPKG